MTWRESNRPNSDGEIVQMHTNVPVTATIVNTGDDDTISLTLKAVVGGVQQDTPEECKMTRESIQPFPGGKLAKFQKFGTALNPTVAKGGDDTVCHSSEHRMGGAKYTHGSVR